MAAFRIFWENPAQKGVEDMKKRQYPDLRLDPEARLCPEFDAVSVKLYNAPEPGKMGVPVVDNCAQEHIM